MKAYGMEVSDFSREAIRREVVRNGLTHWLTLYPPALGIPLGLAGLLFHQPLLYLALLVSLSLGLGSAIVNIFYRDEVVAQRHIEQLNIKLKQMEKLALTTLAKDLAQCRHLAGEAGEYARQAGEQYRLLQDKFSNVEALLDRKLQPGELAFARFLGAAEQVYLSGLDNLRQIEATLRSAGSIDPEYIRRRLQALRRLPQLVPADRQERDTLLRRAKLRQEQLERVNLLLTANEEAMTRLEETTAAIAAMRTGGFARTDYETAIKQLQEMAERAAGYSTPLPEIGEGRARQRVTAGGEAAGSIPGAPAGKTLQ